MLPSLAKSAGLVAAHIVDGFARQLRDVKAVEDMHGGRRSLRDHGEECLPHVARDELDGLRARFAEHVKEGVERLLRSITTDPQQTTTTLVDLVDDRQILVVLLPCELVDVDGSDIVKAAVLEAPLNGLFDTHERPCPSSYESGG
jgi:hypothetical protein